ncbi:MAG: 30S ribosomal protein S9 [Candidatus Taylorbacteria bacterium]
MIKEIKKTEEEAQVKKSRYLEAVGRRKTSMARVRMTVGVPQSSYLINGKDMATYFPTPELQRIILDPLNKTKINSKFEITVQTKGGGIHSQAEAVRHGIARSLLLFDIELRKKLKKAGYLKRDPRMKERRKFGLKKARKAPQWSKR